ncbi:hypothetical protein Z948_782 [Sulfitobacter donghicola DSW-25 = KCTC 12864 = JCM 14565]|nr:hypothetical protein [Sulfitobacter donghicola]KIN67077.1 hypothetical protein Z948_782 [Sulfitobacter donghicola DSW-25 = KCTC 12864 = JCM 14565]
MATHKQGFTIKRYYLKEELGVSEASIKSAFKELRALGIVEEARRKPGGTFEDGSRLTADGKTAFGAAGGKTDHGSIGGKTTSLIQDSQHSKSNVPRPRAVASPSVSDVIDLNDNFAPASTFGICLEKVTSPLNDPLYLQSQERDASWEPCYD